MTLAVVVADDDDDYRLLLRLGLEAGAGATLVGETAHADDLPGLAARTRPDLALLDARMAGAAAAALALRTELPHLRIAITSSLPPSHIHREVSACGAVGSLAKDVPPLGLGGALRDLADITTVAERALLTADRALPRDHASVRGARLWATGRLRGWCDDDAVTSAELLISELATNSLNHAHSDVTVRVAVGATMVRVEVSDRSPEAPVLQHPAATEPRGRGLRIVDELATRWGVQRRRTGKCVWFELPRRRAADNGS